jgi:hypothetical protein
MNNNVYTTLISLVVGRLQQGISLAIINTNAFQMINHLMMIEHSDPLDLGLLPVLMSTNTTNIIC